MFNFLHSFQHWQYVFYLGNFFSNKETSLGSARETFYKSIQSLLWQNQHILGSFWVKLATALHCQSNFNCSIKAKCISLGKVPCLYSKITTIHMLGGQGWQGQLSMWGKCIKIMMEGEHFLREHQKTLKFLKIQQKNSPKSTFTFFSYPNISIILIH